ncbi:MAG: hypothetical protein FWB91_06340 [Defluviitaleaceae bacterium]|nr:hypothetical protein [Defluviitaleaceae bacterium]
MQKEFDAAYFDGLLKNNKASKKQVAVYLDDLKLERIDMITRLFSSISDSKSFARNTLIEDAVDKYIEEASAFLRDEHGIDVGALIAASRYEKYDTVILSANGRGFEDTFLGESEPMCWYPCRISNERENNLRHIAIYRGQPISAITHYAVIKEFKHDPERGYKVCFFEGGPIELPNKITLGDKDSCFFIGAKYTKLEYLLNATTADDIQFC